MNWVLLWVYVLALATWLGETIFLAAVLAPVLFASLAPDQAGAVMALIFPDYHRVGYACGVILVAAPLLIRRRSQPGGGLWLLAAVVAASMLLASLYTGLALFPELDALRLQLREPTAGGAVRLRFDELHGTAERLNVFVLAGQLLLAGLLAARLSRALVMRRRLSRYASDPLL